MISQQKIFVSPLLAAGGLPSVTQGQSDQKKGGEDIVL